ncbi:MAG: N-acetylglucosamine-6-phosphate deacetylase [Halieaceae bacterium]
MSDQKTLGAITAASLFDGSSWMFEHAVVVKGSTVVEVLPLDELPEDLAVTDLGEGVLAPGFIDLQVNGGGGALFTETPTAATLEQMSKAHRATGTTTMMPTLLSTSLTTYQAGIAAVCETMQAGNPAILGLHIEGPFFDSAKRGAHKEDMIRPLQQADIDWLVSANLPLMLTLAPEHCRPGVIETLTEAGLMVCAGHTDASAEQIRAALREGLRGFTHLFNAMSQITARSPGAVGAALDDVQTWVGIIADGHHVHPINLSLAHRAKADGKVCLVTDAMSTVGSDGSAMQLYDEEISEQDGKLVNAEGKLAGSAIGMIQAVEYAHHGAGIELGECLNMASRYPADFLNRNRDLGQLAPGFRADMVHFDEAFVVRNTWLAGSHQQHN